MNEFMARTPGQVGPILRGYRQQRGLTQQALAERLGLPQKTISQIETRPERMSLSRLFAVAGALGIELAFRDQGRPGAGTEW